MPEAPCGDSADRAGWARETEDVEAVVDGHHHRALGRQPGAVVDRGRTRAAGVAAAVDPVQHRQGLGRLRRRPHVQEEAVLGLVDALPPALDADRSRLAGVAHAVPGNDRRRRTPAQLAHGRGRERDALERDDAGDGGFRPLDQTAGDRHRRVGRQHDRRRTALTGGRRRRDCDQPRGQKPQASHPVPHRSPPPRLAVGHFASAARSRRRAPSRITAIE